MSWTSKISKLIEHNSLQQQGSTNWWNVGTAFRGSGGQREEMGVSSVLFCTFLLQNVKIWYFLSQNVEILYFLLRNAKIRHFLSQNLKIRSQRK